MKLERNTFGKIKTMLESPDEENIVMGMSCIENSDFKQNITYILMMLKEANVSIENWKSNAKKTLEMISAIGVNPEETMSFRTIHSKMEEFEVPIEDIRFYEERYAEFIKGRVSDTEYLPKLESITVKIKFKHERRPTGDSL